MLNHHDIMRNILDIDNKKESINDTKNIENTSRLPFAIKYDGDIDLSTLYVEKQRRWEKIR